jgi:hypothetical protein
MLEVNNAIHVELSKGTGYDKKVIESYACFDADDLDKMVDQMKKKIKPKYKTDNGTYDKIVENETYTIQFFTY